MTNWEIFMELQKLIAKNAATTTPEKTAEQPAEKKNSPPKVKLDTSELDAAIQKADELIAKLKTAQLLINCINKD